MPEPELKPLSPLELSQIKAWRANPVFPNDGRRRLVVMVERYQQALGFLWPIYPRSAGGVVVITLPVWQWNMIKALEAQCDHNWEIVQHFRPRNDYNLVVGYECTICNETQTKHFSIGPEDGDKND